MRIKERKFKVCGECGCNREMLSDEIVGCDCCKKVIDTNDDKYKNRISPYLKITVFYKKDWGSSKTKEFIFCTWKCVYKYISRYKKRKNINFISLPYLSWERDIKDGYCGDFFDCIKEA